MWNQTRRKKNVQKGTKTPKPQEEWIITKDAHEAIVEDSLWKSVEERQAQNRRHITHGKGNYRTAHSPHLLAGLLRCQECGANFIINTYKKKGKPDRQYYRCSYNMNRGWAVCTNSRTVRKEKIEGAVLDLLSRELLTEETVQTLLEDVRAELQGQENDAPGCIKDIDRQIQKRGQEIQNLIAAIKAGGSIDELLEELEACKRKKALLEAERRQIEAAEMPLLQEVSVEEICDGLENLKGTLEYATPEERKDLLTEHIRQIEVPKKGEALLEADPEGLLSAVGCFEMVTPRGIA